jgi:brefeldin A-inhibited guanine nucleotide-exchange protein
VTGNAEELRKQAVLFLCSGVLKNLQAWCAKKGNKYDSPEVQKADEVNYAEIRPSITQKDDPTAISNLKQKKDHLIEGIKRFNTKPKKGIQYFLETGCIESKSPGVIAHFLLSTEGLNKAMIGDYLGEGEQENIECMHAFVEQFEFSGRDFVDALRNFFQSFRLNSVWILDQSGP